MEPNPYAVPPADAYPPPAYAPPGYVEAPAVPAQYAPAQHGPAGYAENLPGRPRTTSVPVGYVAAPVIPSAGPIQAFGYTAAALMGAQVLLMLALTAMAVRTVIASAGGSPVGTTLSGLDLAQTLLGALLWPSVLLTGLVFAAWLLVATRNSRAWGSPVRHGAGWALGAWFVPFLNLWRPKHMVDDVWRASHPSAPAGAPLHLVARPGITLLWWSTWLVAPLLAQVGAIKALVPYIEQIVASASVGATVPPPPDVVAMQGTMALWSLWSYALYALCAFAAAVFVVQVTVWQRRRLLEATGEPAGATPGAATATAPAPSAALAPPSPF